MDLLNFVRFAFRTVIGLPSGKKLPGRLPPAARPWTADRLRVNFLTTQGEKLCPVSTDTFISGVMKSGGNRE